MSETKPPIREDRQRMTYGTSRTDGKEPPPKLSKEDQRQGAQLLRSAALSPAAERIALHHRQRALRELHSHLDRSDPRIARALELSAKHRREAERRPTRSADQPGRHTSSHGYHLRPLLND